MASPTPLGIHQIASSETYALVADLNRVGVTTDAALGFVKARAEYLTDKAVGEIPGRVAVEVDRVIGDTREDAAEARSIAQQAYEYNQALVAPVADVVDAVVTDPATESGALVASKLGVREAPLTPYQFGATDALPATDHTVMLREMFARATSADGGEVYLPPGYWNTTEGGLPLANGLVVHGAGRTRSLLRLTGTTAPNLFAWSGTVAGVDMSNFMAEVRTSTGHLFDLGTSGGITASSFTNMFWLTYAREKRLWHHDNPNSGLHLTWNNVEFQRAPDSTAIPLYMRTMGNANHNSFINCRWNGLNNTATEFLYVEPTGGSYASDWTFLNVFGEQNRAGMLTIAGAANIQMNNVQDWDTNGPYVRDVYSFPKATNGPAPIDIILTGVSRRGSSLAEGVNDIYVDPLGAEVILIGCSPFPITQRARISSPRNYTTIIATRYRDTSRAGYTVFPLPPKMPVQGRANFSAVTSEAGSVMYDPNIKKLIVSDGTVWRDTDGNAV